MRDLKERKNLRVEFAGIKLHGGDLAGKFAGIRQGVGMVIWCVPDRAEPQGEDEDVVGLVGGVAF